MNSEIITLFLVDDDPIFLRLLDIEFKQHSNFNIKTFPSGEECILALNENPDIIILDYHLDGINKNVLNGIQTLDQIKLINPLIPVIVLSSQDKIEVAIKCMRHLAHDYVVKSETSFVRLQKIITSLYDIKKMEKILTWYMEKV